MEFIQNLIVTILLGIWAVGSVALVFCLIQNIIHDRNQEKREVARAKRDEEYHEKRMKEMR
jgi:beta-lactamase regulating signal transducer with metallopeptidase domain